MNSQLLRLVDTRNKILTPKSVDKRATSKTRKGKGRWRAGNTSEQTLHVLRFIQERGETHGYDITNTLELKSGTVYPILRRLLEGGLVKAEVAASDKIGRPPKRLFSITEAGEQHLNT
ncbi:MAG: PadR family transcriptional regulator [Deinococcota bacterium]